MVKVNLYEIKQVNRRRKKSHNRQGHRSSLLREFNFNEVYSREVSFWQLFIAYSRGVAFFVKTVKM